MATETARYNGFSGFSFDVKSHETVGKASDGERIPSKDNDSDETKPWRMDTPWKINGWNPKMKVWKMMFLFNCVMFRFCVNFQESCLFCFSTVFEAFKKVTNLGWKSIVGWKINCVVTAGRRREKATLRRK